MKNAITMMENQQNSQIPPQLVIGSQLRGPYRKPNNANPNNKYIRF